MSILRSIGKAMQGPMADLVDELDEENERLRAERDALADALRPFVDYLNPKALMQGTEWIGRFEEYQAIARAALEVER